MKWQGPRKAKILKTSADVLEHSYGISASSEPGEIDVEVEMEPEPEPEESPESEETPETEDEPMDEAQYASSLVDSMRKDELSALAESLGLDVDGTKADIAARIAAKKYSDG